MNIYFDVCCLNRPFDDQTQDRIHMESEAVIMIFKHIEMGTWYLINSGVINYEINQTKCEERRNRLYSLVKNAHFFITVEQQIFIRSLQIQKLGIKTYDALHIACAEQAKADIFLTTDNKLIKIAQQHYDKIFIIIDNPLIWLQKRFEQ